VSGYILDTNVVSELMRKTPDSNVLVWLDSVDTPNLWITTITITEINRGILLLNVPERVDELSRRFERLLYTLFRGRVLSLDEGCAYQTAEYLVRSEIRLNPRHHLADAIIAGSAIFHRLGVATRNVADFDSGLVKVVDPWKHL